MTRAINFVIIFLLCLALVLFSLQNTDPVVIKLFRGIDIQAPLCIEMIVTMGLGAVLAWMFSMWSRLLRVLESRKQMRQIREKDSRIQQLEKDLEQLKAESSESRLELPVASESVSEAA